MSTPVKPPGGPPQGPQGTADPSDASGVAPSSGAFGEAVERARSASAEPAASGAVDGLPTSPVGEVVADLRAGRLDAEAAVEQLVERALRQAAGLSAEHRDALAAQLRQALSEDPTLAALRRDLERASTS